jgi:uncharacterized protein YggT (Ycf19 family)
MVGQHGYAHLDVLGFSFLLIANQFLNIFLLLYALHWYNPSRLTVSFSATVAQLAEQAFRKRQVKGSNPFGGLIN